MVVRTFACTLLLLVGCSDYNLVGEVDDNGPGDEDSEIPDDIATGGVTGRICGPDGESWVVGAEVEVQHTWGVETGETDADGWFTIEGVPVGQWDVVVTKGQFSVTFTVQIVEDQVTELPVEECIEQGDVEIAVVEGDFDNIEHILSGMGLDYTFYSWSEATSLLRNPSEMDQYDLIFFNCGMDDTWAWSYQAEVASNLRDFVSNGGSVYASDWAYYIVEAGWPTMNTFYGDDSYPGDAYVGESGMVTANVIDPNMQARLSSNTAALDYNLPSWAVLEVNNQGSVLLEGQVTLYDWWTGQYNTITSPLAAQYHDGGSVIYTSFHNEAQTTVDMHLLLQEIILSL